MMKHLHITYPALAIALCACGSSDSSDKSSEVEDLPIVEIDLAGLQDVDQTRTYTANVEAYNINNISPSAYNRIKEIRVDVGDHVSRGQVLVTLDHTSANQLKVNIDEYERQYNRAVQLLNIGSGTQATVDQLKAQLDAARTQYNNILENTVLTSPVSGVVTARNYDPGDMSGTQPVLTIGQITPAVKVVIGINEAERSKIAAGMPIEVTFDAFPDENFSAKISRVYPSVDPQTRTFQAEVVIPNAGEKLFPGMFARCTVSLGVENHVVVPDRAVVKQTGSGNKYVYVYKNGKVKYNRVEIGRRVDTSYEVISGVNNGDTVVIAGQSRLSDGVPVQLKEIKSKTK
jgi:RND family efflux transporter MFP subunit